MNQLISLVTKNFQEPRQKFLWFLLSLLIFVIDQLTKIWASNVLLLGQSVGFLPFFDFALVHNFGAAFGLLAEAGGWQRLFLGVVALLVSVFLMFWMLTTGADKKLEIAGLAFILGGALGNLWDRIVLGYVVDFIDWFYPAGNGDCLPFFYFVSYSQTCHWPTFNLADAAILFGAACLIIDMLLGQRDSSEAA